MAAFGKSKAKKVDSSDEDSPVLSKKKSTVISDRKRGLFVDAIELLESFFIYTYPASSCSN